MNALKELQARFDKTDPVLSPIEHLVIISINATDKEKLNSLEELAALRAGIETLRAENDRLREKLVSLSIHESKSIINHQSKI